MSDHTKEYVNRSSIKLYGDELVCPNCGGGYLHHEKVLVYVREKEDGLTSTVRVDAFTGDTLNLRSCGDAVPSGVDFITHNPTGNPSSRRGGIRILFSCEECDSSIHMTIAQHKGRTNIEMEHIEHGRFSVVAWP